MNRAALEHIPNLLRVLWREKMVSVETLAERISSLPLPPELLTLLRERFRRLQTAHP